jgi:hypothetical protein
MAETAGRQGAGQAVPLSESQARIPILVENRSLVPYNDGGRVMIPRLVL